MKELMSRHQTISVLSMFVLLVAASVFDRWQEHISQMFGETFEHKYLYLNLWSVSIAALVFAICWLVLFRFTRAHPNKATAILFLVVGICILFYPPIMMPLGVTSKIGISVSYFGDTILFYSAAIAAAIGILGLQKSNPKG
jgi:hypothetical protein